MSKRLSQITSVVHSTSREIRGVEEASGIIRAIAAKPDGEAVSKLESVLRGTIGFLLIVRAIRELTTPQKSG